MKKTTAAVLFFGLTCFGISIMAGAVTNVAQNDQIEKLEHRIEQLESGR